MKEGTSIQDIPAEELFKHPEIQKLLKKVENNEDSPVDLNTLKLPYIMRNKVLMSPGIWNSFLYDNEPIHKAFNTTSWDKKEVTSLFLDHEDNKSKEWIGDVINPRLEGDTIIGDLSIVDKPTAIKLAYGAKMGISPKVSGMEDEGRMVEFTFDNFSVVINPAVKTAYINNSDNSEETEEGKVSVQLKKEAPYGQVDYADPGYREDKKRYPIDTEAHIRAAWSYINVPKNQKGYSADQLKNIKAKIKSAAKKFGISIKNMEVKNMAEEENTSGAEETTPEATEEKTNEMSANDLAQILSELKNIGAETLKAVQSLSEKKEDKPEDKKEDEKKEDKPEDKKEDEKKKEEDKKEMSGESEKVVKEMSEDLKKKDTVIQELSERLNSIESKFNEPDKKTVKAEMNQEASGDPDMNFMNMLKAM